MGVTTTRVIRASCIQQHVKYHCLNLNQKENMDELLIKLVHLLDGRVMKKDSRGIIFFVSKSHCTEFASKHQFLHHISQQPTENQQALNAWIEGKCQWMCATPGLAQGIDLPYVDGILFAEHPYGMVDFVQACGRGGRKGRTCYAVVLHAGKVQSQAQTTEDYECLDEMHKWCQEKVSCHRYWIGKAMDGVPQSCSDGGLAPCERCDPHDSTTKLILQSRTLDLTLAPSHSTLSLKRALDHLDITDSGKRSRSRPDSPTASHGSTVPSPASGPAVSRRSSLQLLKDKGKEAEDRGLHSKLQSAILRHGNAQCQAKVPLLDAALVVLQSTCVGCWFLKKGKKVASVAGACQSCDEDMKRIATALGCSGYFSWKGSIKYKTSYAMCFSCNIPQGIYEPPCHKGSMYGTGKQHPTRDIVARTCFIGRLYEVWWQAIYNEFHLPCDMSMQNYCSWLVACGSVDSFDNMLRVFMYMYDTLASASA
jgi:Helicase conserved C-terminal domain